MDRLTTDPRFNDVTFFKVDFDSSKEFLRELKVNRQSTFVVFKGNREQARSTGETNVEALQALFDRSH